MSLIESSFGLVGSAKCSLDYVRSGVDKCLNALATAARLDDETIKLEHDEIRQTATEAVQENCHKASKIVDDISQFRKLKESMRASGSITCMGIQQALPVLINSHFDELHRESSCKRKEYSNYYKNLNSRRSFDDDLSKDDNRDSFSWKKPVKRESNDIFIRRASIQCQTKEKTARCA